MSKSNLTISLNEDAKKQLDELVQYFNKQSISNVSKTDVITFIIGKSYEMITNPNREQILDTYKKFNIEPDTDSVEDYVKRLNNFD